eukprot:5853811-Pyramimonas_sp.AAC.1
MAVRADSGGQHAHSKLGSGVDCHWLYTLVPNQKQSISKADARYGRLHVAPDCRSLSCVA